MDPMGTSFITMSVIEIHTLVSTGHIMGWDSKNLPRVIFAG